MCFTRKERAGPLVIQSLRDSLSSARHLHFLGRGHAKTANHSVFEPNTFACEREEFNDDREQEEMRASALHLPSLIGQHLLQRPVCGDGGEPGDRLPLHS